MNDLIRKLKDDIPWYMLFANDVVLVNEIREGLSRKLDSWRDALKTF